MGLDILEQIKEKVLEEKEVCIGRLYRGYSSTYVQGGDIGKREGLRLLKRKSCPGCSKCGWMDDFISEEIWAGWELDSIENGALYRLSFSGGGRNYEGDYDDIIMEVIKEGGNVVSDKKV